MIATLHCEMLSKHPRFLPSTIDSGEKAINLLKENNYDLVVSDYIMPEMNGLELYSWVRKNKPNIGFIMVSSHPPNIPMGCPKLVKPVEAKVLIETAVKSINKVTPGWII